MPKTKFYLRKQSATPRQSNVEESSRYFEAKQITSPTANQLMTSPKNRVYKMGNVKSYTSFKDYQKQSIKDNQKDHLVSHTPKNFSFLPAESIYQQDYLRRQGLIQDIPRVKQHFFEQQLPEGRIDMMSTQKHDYKAFDSQRVSLSSRQRPLSSNVLFQGKSTYAVNFVNWKSGDCAQLMPHNHPTVLKDMPFMGRSLYADSFKGFNSPPTESFKGAQQHRSPLNPPDMPAQKESTSKRDFRPFKTSQSQSDILRVAVQMKPSYQGQYRTNYQKDFTDKIREEKDIEDRYLDEDQYEYL